MCHKLMALDLQKTGKICDYGRVEITWDSESRDLQRNWPLPFRKPFHLSGLQIPPVYREESRVITEFPSKSKPIASRILCIKARSF